MSHVVLLFWGSKLCPVHRAEAQKGREGNKMRNEHEASVASDALLPQTDTYTLPSSATKNEKPYCPPELCSLPRTSGLGSCCTTIDLTKF